MARYEEHLLTAAGYIDLGMWLEADAELDQIEPLMRGMIPVLMTRQKIYHALDRPESLEAVTVALEGLGIKRAS